MKKMTLMLFLTMILTACGANATGTATHTAGTQSGASTGELSTPLQVAIGTIKLDESDNAVTAKQAAELLPLWETLQVLESSDTAAQEEKDALVSQIQETMTQGQMQAITALNLTRQDMFSIMQSQGGSAFGGGQNGNPQSSNSSNNSGRNFNPGGGFPGGAPPDGGFPGGGPASDQGSSRTRSTGAAQNSNRQVIADPNRIPTPLLQAVIEYLKKKAGA